MSSFNLVQTIYSFVTAMVLKGAELHRDSFEVTEPYLRLSQAASPPILSHNEYKTLDMLCTYRYLRIKSCSRTDRSLSAMQLLHVQVRRTPHTDFLSFIAYVSDIIYQSTTYLSCYPLRPSFLGYRNAFPFFEDHHPELCIAGKNPRTNFKQVMSI